MSRIALLRHHPTDWNGEGRIQGRTDRPLTEAARAALAGLALPPPWDEAEIVASPLARARDTAHALARERPIRFDARLVELSFGAWEGRLGADLLADPASGYVPIERWGWQRRPPGGESPADGLARVAPLLGGLAEAGRPALLICHRALMRAVLGQAWGWDFLGPEPFTIKRGRLYPLTVGPDGAASAPEPPVRLVPRR